MLIDELMVRYKVAVEATEEEALDEEEGEEVEGDSETETENEMSLEKQRRESDETQYSLKDINAIYEKLDSMRYQCKSKLSTIYE